MFRVVTIALIAACSSGDSEPKPAAPPPPPADAAVDGITAIDQHDPDAAHLDDDPIRPSPRPANKRPGRPIEILLRSSPPGATTYVDGIAIGTTPTYWVGETGAEHEFTFSMPKHATARYRFFPITSGTLHTRLDPVANDVDAGVPPAHLVAPPPIAPPQTVVTPVATPDAAVTFDAAPVEPTPPPTGPTPF